MRNGIALAALAALVGVLGLMLWPGAACGCAGPATVAASACFSSVKRQALGIGQYAADSDGRFPLSESWMDRTAPYLPRGATFHEPALPKGMSGYAYDAALAHAREPASAERVPMVYDSTDARRNASDMATSLPRPGRHHGKDNVAYADGHAKAVRTP